MTLRALRQGGVHLWRRRRTAEAGGEAVPRVG